MIAGDAHTTCEGFTTELEMDSDAPLDRVAHMIKMAEQTCFTMAALRNALPCELKAMVNGETLALG